MNYTRNHHTNLTQFHAMFHAENCVLLSFQSFLCARQHYVNEVLYIQGPFDKIQGLLGKIQGLFKDLSKFFNFLGLFKGLMPFQLGLFKARANHVENVKHVPGPVQEASHAQSRPLCCSSQLMNQPQPILIECF